MGARSVASVVLSFGLSNIRIKLYLAASPDQVSFNMINPKTGNRISQKLFDKETGEEVQRNEILKGYEYARDKFITFTDDEIANMQAQKRDTLDIKEFIPVSEIDPLHIEKTLYTAPDKGFDRSYALLYQALLLENKAAVGTWVSRGKEHLVVIRAYQHGLIMHQMFYNTEVRTFENLCAPTNISPIELGMAKMLISQFYKEKFDKSTYSDRFIEKVNTAVQMKMNSPGEKVKETPASEPKMINLADLLRESLLAIGVKDTQINDMVSKTQTVQAVIPEKKTARKAKKVG